MSNNNNNLCIIAIGMSGTGKTTFVNVNHAQSRNLQSLTPIPFVSISILQYEPFPTSQSSTLETIMTIGK